MIFIKFVIIDLLMGSLSEARNEIGNHIGMELAPWRMNLTIPSSVSSGDYVSTNQIGSRVLSMGGIGMVLS